jgi:hypothetical protein
MPVAGNEAGCLFSVLSGEAVSKTHHTRLMF